MLSAELIILTGGAVAAAFAVIGILARRGVAKNLDDYIIFRNRTGSLAATCSVVACLTGAWILYSVPEAAAGYGVAAIVGYAIGQGLPMLLLVPVGARVRREYPKGRSLSDYVEARFGRTAALFVLGFMFLYMLVFLCAEMTAVGGAFNTVAGFPVWATAAAVMAFTLAYAVYGGLPSSILTDVVQFLVILPLLLLVLVAVFGGSVDRVDLTSAKSAQLFDFGSWSGIQFGIVLIIGVTASNLFHQGFWQRIYSCTTEKVMKRSFGIAGVITIVMIALAGVFGLLAGGAGMVGGKGQPAAAQSLFVLIKFISPVFLIVVLVLALSLTMSSSDTLLNAMASILMLRKAGQPHDEKKALKLARSITALLGVLAVLVAALNISVLYLFLVVDLLAAATIVPVIAGLWWKRYGLMTLVASSLSGLVVGGLFFPGPDYVSLITASWWPGATLSSDTLFLLSFGLALTVSTVVTLAGEKGYRKKVSG